MWCELVLFVLNVGVRALEHDACRQLLSVDLPCRAAPPFALRVRWLRRLGELARRATALRHSAVADASAVEPKSLIGRLEQRAAVLVPPVPGEDSLAAEDIAEAGMAAQLVTLRLEVRVQLMVREE